MVPSGEVFRKSHTIWGAEELHKLYIQSLFQKSSMYWRSLNLDICFSSFWAGRSPVELGWSFTAELALVWDCWNQWLCPRLFFSRWKNSSLNATLISFPTSLHSLLLWFMKKGTIMHEMSQNYDSSEQTHLKEEDNVFMESASIF